MTSRLIPFGRWSLSFCKSQRAFADANTKEIIMNADTYIHMTGPHPSRIKRGRKVLPSWHVSLVGSEREPQGTVYRCLSYRRAVSLSCNMARDRRLFLHLEAMPR